MAFLRSHKLSALLVVLLTLFIMTIGVVSCFGDQMIGGAISSSTISAASANFNFGTLFKQAQEWLANVPYYYYVFLCLGLLLLTIVFLIVACCKKGKVNSKHVNTLIVTGEHDEKVIAKMFKGHYTVIVSKASDVIQPRVLQSIESTANDGRYIPIPDEDPAVITDNVDELIVANIVQEPVAQETVEEIVEYENPLEVENVADENPLEVEDVADENPLEVEDVADENPLEVEDIADENPLEVEDIADENPLEVEDVADENPLEVEDEEVIEPVAEEVIEPVAEEVIEPVAEEVIEQVSEEVIEQVSEEVIEQVSEEVLATVAEDTNIVPILVDIDKNEPESGTNLSIGIDIDGDGEVDGIYEDKTILKLRYKTVDLDKRICRASEEAKGFYSDIKNALLSYNGVKSRLSKKFDTFTIGRFTVAKLALRGNILNVYLALASEQLDDKYFAEDVGRSDTYGSTPTLHKVKSKRGCKYGVDLITELMKAINAEPLENFEAVDYVAMYPPENIEEKKLAIANLIGDAIHADDTNILSDEDAVEFIQIVKSTEHTINKFNPINKFVAYVDEIADFYESGDTVTIDSLIEKGALPEADNLFLEIRGKGLIEKKLTFEAHSFDIKAVKMITLTGGDVIQYK